MFRIVYQDFVDISYASSALSKLYDQTTGQDVYYDIVTKAAEHASEGCANAICLTLEEAKELIDDALSINEAVESMTCVWTHPQSMPLS